MTFLNMMDELNYQRTKYDLNQKLSQLINQEGYISFEPDFFEDYENFMLKNRRVKKENMVKMIDQDGRILVLRPDITTLLMRQIVPKWQQDSVIRLFYHSTIFKRNALGKLDTQRQFGVELLGEKRIEADLEILSIVSKVLDTLDVDYVVELSDTRFLDFMMSELNLNEKEQNEFKDILFRKSSYDLMRFTESKTMSKAMSLLLDNIFSLQGSIEDVEKKMSKLYFNEVIQSIFNDLKKRLALVNRKKKWMVDLSLVSTYDYYEGILFKGFIHGSNNAVLSGGRYDPLTEQYGKKIPAIGFTLNTQELVKEVLR
ncbi:MAG: hypothetical protein A2Y45_08585 [Tenericutes bacterium GWC2_34_14]|nr:MAG: hypothetical protein A2Y45_08585 [Tenericutes bacterium GWC2_34_14]OHE34931.1 MAG: hypothetical protein A2012_02195 [Tenericutes bacterium GWE2_34_108]OHE37209.1 MAG: hypothetical protein A2Y46_00815 [Tenericutes bacterium GWF1_35_14]OHE39659.1 MAG: hypothetical protein A2Y44_02045 [Tenericutes bacterium GWF2_35_184]OHE44153.1 MAG: hypothetical protein A2221_03465 [Tenericutes bacterium RIFOXYA2_FULL_36_32]OHE45498.1 MAG: hypothetical protein A3K26_01070 [Tenericutes bacterium RIFOXYA1